MNAQDRHFIARLLVGISSGDCVSQIAAGTRLMTDHPKIIDEMELHECEWWGFKLNEKDTETKP